MKLNKKTKEILNWVALVVGLLGVLVALYGLLRSVAGVTR